MWCDVDDAQHDETFGGYANVDEGTSSATHRRVPPRIRVHLGGDVATFALRKTKRGWAQTFAHGDGALKGRSVEYMCNENLAALREWWNQEYDRVELCYDSDDA